jgi:uncharacterized protein (DUF4415 family)
MKRKQALSKRRFRLNTPAEEARIQAGIKADPDARELSVQELSQMRPYSELRKQRGRPKSAVHKTPVMVRLDPEIVEFFRGGGPGWQTRMNKALAEYVSKQRRPRA